MKKRVYEHRSTKASFLHYSPQYITYSVWPADWMMVLWNVITAVIGSPIPAPKSMDAMGTLRNRTVASCETIRTFSGIHKRIRVSMQRRVDVLALMEGILNISFSADVKLSHMCNQFLCSSYVLVPIVVKRVEDEAVMVCSGGGNGRIPRKPTEQRQRPLRFLKAQCPSVKHRESSPVHSIRGERSGQLNRRLPSNELEANDVTKIKCGDSARVSIDSLPLQARLLRRSPYEGYVCVSDANIAEALWKTPTGVCITVSPLRAGLPTGMPSLRRRLTRTSYDFLYSSLKKSVFSYVEWHEDNVSNVRGCLPIAIPSSSGMYFLFVGKTIGGTFNSFVKKHAFSEQAAKHFKQALASERAQVEGREYSSLQRSNRLRAPAAHASKMASLANNMLNHRPLISLLCMYPTVTYSNHTLTPSVLALVAQLHPNPPSYTITERKGQDELFTRHKKSSNSRIRCRHCTPTHHTPTDKTIANEELGIFSLPTPLLEWRYFSSSCPITPTTTLTHTHCHPINTSQFNPNYTDTIPDFLSPLPSKTRNPLRPILRAKHCLEKGNKLLQCPTRKITLPKSHDEKLPQGGFHLSLELRSRRATSLSQPPPPPFIITEARPLSAGEVHTEVFVFLGGNHLNGLGREFSNRLQTSRLTTPTIFRTLLPATHSLLAGSSPPCVSHCNRLLYQFVCLTLPSENSPQTVKPIRLRVLTRTASRGHGGLVGRLLTPHPGEQGSIPGRVAFGFPNVGIVPDDVAGRRYFSGIAPFPRREIPVLLHLHRLSSFRSAWPLRAAQISPLDYAVSRALPRHATPVHWRRADLRSRDRPHSERRTAVASRKPRLSSLVPGSRCVVDTNVECMFLGPLTVHSQHTSHTKRLAGHCNFLQRQLKAVHDKVNTFEINPRKRSLLLPAYISTDALGDMRSVMLVTMEGKVFLYINCSVYRKQPTHVLLDNTPSDLIHHTWSMHDGAPPDLSRTARAYLVERIPAQANGTCLEQSPGLHVPLISTQWIIYYLWGYLNTIVQATPVTDNPNASLTCGTRLPASRSEVCLWCLYVSIADAMCADTEGSLPESYWTMPLVGPVFSGISRLPPSMQYDAAPYSPRFTLIGSQDLAAFSEFKPGKLAVRRRLHSTVRQRESTQGNRDAITNRHIDSALVTLRCPKQLFQFLSGRRKCEGEDGLGWVRRGGGKLTEQHSALVAGLVNDVARSEDYLRRFRGVSEECDGVENISYVAKSGCGTTSRPEQV
ncbi:hypothetical protein PR048_006244 [Dryococelus australis]|uniref:Uncharacterized protein n=1 Tax=Dryococelus australis TaxID=614101 RepID=A0ABQ9IAE6_9NEOP|nr:hypothetical protein PR048_006244 [Dryococelus australis]